VAVLRVPAFMATLGTMSIADGTGLLLTNGIPIYGMPSAWVAIAGRAIMYGLPIALYVAAVVVALLWFAIKFTRFGRYIYATGGNLQAAMVSGIPTRTMLMLSYMLASMLGSVTGLLLTAEIGSGQATTGESLMLESIAAAVLAGISLRGGIGRIELVVLAAIFLLTLTNAMDLMRVDTRLQLIILGVVLAVAVSAEALSRREAVRV
jgi:ribose transport system permease protein